MGAILKSDLRQEWRNTSRHQRESQRLNRAQAVAKAGIPRQKLIKIEPGQVERRHGHGPDGSGNAYRLAFF